MRWDWTDDWVKGSDYLVELFDLYDVIDPDAPSLVTTATVQFYAYNDLTNGTPLQGPTAMAHQGSGRYTGVLADTVSVEKGSRVRLEVTANDGANKQLAKRGLLVVR